MYYPRIDETVTFRRLKNGLPAYVVHKPGYTRKYAMFATRYGGMDLRFQQWTMQRISVFWKVNLLSCWIWMSV